MATEPQILIIYNADSTIRGKLTYAYKKLSSSGKEEPVCGACEITHGGLSLKEVPGWVKTKSEIEAKGFEVIQWHRDEIKADVKEWTKTNGIRYPTVLLRTKRESMEELSVVADTKELASCAGDASTLVEILESKGVFSSTSNV